MGVLYYWRRDNYVRDRRFGFGWHLSQETERLAELRSGDSVWAFTRARSGAYVLAAELVVRHVTRNRAGYRYGTWRVWGDLDRSRYFDVDRGPDVEPVVRSLDVRAGGAVLGRAFQGRAAVRPLSEADEGVLRAFAAELPVLERVAIYPEEELEARLVYGEVAQALVREEPDGERTARERYLHETLRPGRSRRLVAELQRLYGGRCQICLFDPRGRYGHPLCHGHHVHWLSRGGEDELGNLVLVCPSHHAAIHRDDAAFDHREGAFLFSNGLRERLREDRHLAAAG